MVNAGIGIDSPRDRLPLRGILAVVDTLSYLGLFLGFGLARAFGMGRGPERGAAVMGLPRRRRRGARLGKGKFLQTEYMLNLVINDALRSRGVRHARQEKIAALSKILAALVVLMILAGFPREAGAAAITPDDVYRITGTINGELKLLHESNESMPVVDTNAPELTPRRPRHVMQKAREVLLKVQLLRRINGLDENELPPLPLREVRPADVKVVIDLIRRDLAALRSIFGVTEVPFTVPILTGKTPTDVYGDLVRAGEMLDGLGIPKIVPNDVYRVALTIIGDLEKVRAARGLTEPVPLQRGSRDKRPSDVYAKAAELLRTLRTLTSENPGFQIPGGIVLLNQRSGRIEPAHVMDLLNNILAEISAIKVKVGARSLTEFAPPQAGKTPSHVYDPVATALLLAETLE